jgi:CheY-like chemotaxis protein
MYSEARISDLVPCHVPPETKIRTLVVDDVRTLLAAICNVLELQPGIEIVAQAENGAQALLAAQELRPDLVIMDVSMPIMNGLEAALRLKEKLPGVKLVLMSADDDPDTQEACHTCGADVFVWKGHIATDLPARIKELFFQDQPHCTPCEYLLAAGQDVDVYDFHNQHYEYCRDLLEYAQSIGSTTLARTAAGMLLFHLRQLFRNLPGKKRQLLRRELEQQAR